MKCLRVIYEGMVQGVGFRYTVVRFARDLGLKGKVKNLPDGSVEMIVVGVHDEIKKLCLSIENYFETNITNVKKSETITSQDFSDFQITF